MFSSEGDNLLLWCGWWDAQTSDSVENPAGVSRARKVWSSSPELETSNRPFYSHHPSIPLLSQSVMGTWLDYWGPTGSSFFSRLVDWIRYTFRRQRMMGWLGNQGLIQGFTSQILIPILPIQTIFLGVKWESDYWFCHWTRKSESWKYHCLGSLVKSKLSKNPWIKTAS